MKRALLVIAKRPRPGRTKTRLTPPLSSEQAAQLYQCLLQDTIDLARAVQQETVRFILYAPLDAANYFKQLAPDFELLPQTGASLGERLDNALTGCLNQGFNQVVVINSDGPTLPAAHIAQAFDSLCQAEVVLGPAADGGYYLIGLTRPQPRLLREVKMSTPAVLQDTLALAQEDGLAVSLLPPWYDIDTIKDLQRLARELSQQTNGMARHTQEFLRREIGSAAIQCLAIGDEDGGSSVSQAF